MDFTVSDNYREKYFDEKFSSIGGSLHKIEKGLDDNTKVTHDVRRQAEKTNGRVTKLEAKVEKVEQHNTTPRNYKQLGKNIGAAVGAALLAMGAIYGAFRGSM